MEPLEAFACICAKTIHYGSGMWYLPLQRRGHALLLINPAKE
jgi:hypothetical protein